MTNNDYFVSWFFTGGGIAGQGSYRNVLSHRDLLMMNVIAPCYHSGFGYHIDENYVDEDSATNISRDLFPELVTVEKEDGDDSLIAHVDCQKAGQLAKEFKFHHKSVIVRNDFIGESHWRNKPSRTKQTRLDENPLSISEALDWYNLPERVTSYNYTLIGPMTDRPYIHVTNPYEQLEILSTDKRSPITLDDVLFACRGLCVGPTRSIDEFSVLSDDGSILTLLVGIDNWST